jgi:hypothetical protein
VLDTLVLSVTYSCPIQCDFCGVHAGPHRKGMMGIDTIKRLIDEAKTLKTFSVVVFTGGEPTLLGKHLVEAVRYASDAGFLTRIVSNAVWATSPKKAISFLQRFKEAGLTELNYSVGDFHQKFIPLEHIKWASDAAASLEIPLLIAAKGIKNSKITPAYLEEFFEGKLTRHIPNEKIIPGTYCYTYGVTIPVGWNADKVSDDDLIWPEEKDCWKGPCKSILKSVVIRHTGDLSICCGIGSDEIPETVIGNIHDSSLIDLIVEANNDLMVNWLALEGPYGIIQFLQNAAPDLKFRDQYIGICHACHDVLSDREVRQVLASKVDSAVPRLVFERAWLENHRDELVTHTST